MGLIAWIFEDNRYGRERLWLIASLLVSLAITLGGGWFLYQHLVRENPPEPLLTADQLPPDETFHEPVPTSPLLPATQAAAAGRFEEARQLVAEVQEDLDSSDQARALTLLANIERHDNNHEQALDYLDQAIAMETTAWRVFLRGDTLRRLGRLDEAAKNLTLAQTLSPAQPLYSNAVLLLDLQRGNQETVAQTIALRSSLGLDNTRPGWVFAAAALELANEQPNLAAISLRHGVRALPSDHVDFLLDFAPLSQFKDEGPVMAFFIKTSTERLLPPPQRP